MTINTTNSPIVGADGALIPAMGDITGKTARAIENTYAGLIVEAVEPPADGTANIADADTLSITNSAGDDAHDATVSITGNDIDSISLADTVTMVDDGDTFDTVDGGTLAVAVSDGVPTFTYTAAG